MRRVRKKFRAISHIIIKTRGGKRSVVTRAAGEEGERKEERKAVGLSWPGFVYVIAVITGTSVRSI